MPSVLFSLMCVSCFLNSYLLVKATTRIPTPRKRVFFAALPILNWAAHAFIIIYYFLTENVNWIPVIVGFIWSTVHLFVGLTLLGILASFANIASYSLKMGALDLQIALVLLFVLFIIYPGVISGFNMPDIFSSWVISYLIKVSLY